MAIKHVFWDFVCSAISAGKRQTGWFPKENERFLFVNNNKSPNEARMVAMRTTSTANERLQVGE